MVDVFFASVVAYVPDQKGAFMRSGDRGMSIQSSKRSMVVSLQFEKAQLPPFNDILVLGRKSPVGMSGVTKSLEYLVPNNFEVVALEHDVVEAMVVNKAILKRMSVDTLTEVLAEAVFPYMSDVEIMKVDLTVRVNFEGRLENDQDDG
jgi:hypothetical protein